MNNWQDKESFIWSIAELLRGDYKQSDYGKIILPLTVLRRLDCVLEPTKDIVLQENEKLKARNIKNLAPVLNKISGQNFYNLSKYNFEKLTDDPSSVVANFRSYINGFSDNAREIIDYFDFNVHVDRLDSSDLLYKILKRFSEIDLHPDVVSNIEMGYIFENLIRRFSEQSNETAGEHFTPREVIELMVNLLFIEEDAVLRKPGIVRTLYDPACGTGGMLLVSEKYLRQLNQDARLEVFGQELNPESYAVCKSDMLLKGRDPGNIKFGNSFSNDGLHGESFDYMLSNPPFGVEWKKVEKEIKKEYEEQGFNGRFGAGLPRINDGSFLFLQHMISKMKPIERGGSRIGIVFNGSPLFTGAADSGESNIRKWIIEQDWLEAIVALPDQLFYNTGISTYIWILTNRKEEKRKGKIQLINGNSFFQKMRKSLGNKRQELNKEHLAELTRIYGEYENSEFSKIFDNEDFGYSRITVERPLKLNFQICEERINKITFVKAFEESKETILKILQSKQSDKIFKNREEFIKTLKAIFKNTEISYNANLEKALLNGLSEKDETADICKDSKGNTEADSDLRDYENIPLKHNIKEYFEKEVLPHVPDAWIDESKTKIGYEIPFTRHFYVYKPLRPLDKINDELKIVEDQILNLLQGVSA